jgi:uncharacterized protein YecT (DUF1311 family)
MTRPSRFVFAIIAACMFWQTAWADGSKSGERTVTGIVDGQKFGTNVRGDGTSVTFEADSENEARLLKACDVGSRCKVVVATKGADVVVRLVSAQRVDSSAQGVSKAADARPATVVPKGPSFSCAKAVSRAERMICADSTLSMLDRDLALAYKRTHDAKDAERSRLLQAQLDWVRAKRNACTDAACLDTVYRDRIQELARKARGNF